MNKYLRICLIFSILFSVSSCTFLSLFLDYSDYFIFNNESDYAVLLLFDYDTSNNEMSIESIAEGRYMIGYCQEHNVTMIDDTYWDENVNDSLHLYILKDAITLDSIYIKYPQYKKQPFIKIYEDFITEEYMEEYLEARMTLKLEDIYPTTYPPKEIHFPPENDSDYNTIYYSPTFASEQQ